MKWCRRKPAQAALIAVAILLTVSSVTAVGIRNHQERERVQRVRGEVESFLAQGQRLLISNDLADAQKAFHEAWARVDAEPTLSDFRIGVLGWLDHSRRAAEQQVWKSRVPPREFDDYREEATLLSARLDPIRRRPIQDARAAIQTALDFTVPNDPAWDGERERLDMLDADLILLETGDAEKALARLGPLEHGLSRIVHERRAAYLGTLNRSADATTSQEFAARMPPEVTNTRFSLGVERLRNGKPTEALSDFEAVLNREPEHFPARLLFAVACLNEKRAAEAHIALTACIAQRPRFVWNYILRGDARSLLGETAAATSDWQKALELQPRDTARFAVVFRLGTADLHADAMESAGAAFLDLTRMAPQEPAAWRSLAELEQKRGRMEEADRHRRTAHELMEVPR